MTFKKGDPKPANGGRKKGTPNKVTLGVREFLENNNFNPLIKCLELYEKTKKEETKLRILELLSKYCYPQFKAVELTSAGNTFEIVINRKKVAIEGGGGDNAGDTAD